MIKYLLSISILLLVFISCQSEIQCDQPPEISVDQSKLESQINQIESYLENEGIEYESHSSGIRYSVLESGVGNSPSYCSAVIIDFEGRVIGEDETFVSAIEANYSLRSNQVVVGFKMAITQMNQGADYRVFIPGELLINKGISEVLPRNIPIGENVEFRIRVNSY
jgi:FKBP-type peptidyl-prolyl cis-trans isomerase